MSGTNLDAIRVVLDLHTSEWSCGNPAHMNPDVGCPECVEYCIECGDPFGNSMVIVDGRIIAFRGHDSRPTARYCYVNGQKDFVSGITEHLFFPPQPGRHYEGMSAQTGFKHK